MQLSLPVAIEELDKIQTDFVEILTYSQLTALDYGKGALQTIEDGNFILKGVNDMDKDTIQLLQSIQHNIRQLVIMEQHPTKSLYLSQISWAIQDYLNKKGV